MMIEYREKEVLEKWSPLVNKFMAMYSECKDCYRDYLEMQMCIEEDLMCCEVYDEVEQEIIAKHISYTIFSI